MQITLPTLVLLAVYPLMSATTDLHLTAHRDGRIVVVEIADDGSGIPTDELRHRGQRRHLSSAWTSRSGHSNGVK